MLIIIYTKTNCPWSHEVIEFLNSKNIKFVEKDMLKDKSFMQEAIDNTGQSSSPTLDIGGHILADTDKDQVEAYLKSISYF